jgi:hypothetical protein
MFLIFILTLTESLCCAWIIYVILCRCWCPEIRTSSIDWAQLTRLSPDDGYRIQSPKRCVLKKNRKMDNVQKQNNCINIPPFSFFVGYSMKLTVSRLYRVDARMNNEYGAQGGIITGRRNRSTQNKPFSSSFCPQQMQQNLTWD